MHPAPNILSFWATQKERILDKKEKRANCLITTKLSPKRINSCVILNLFQDLITYHSNNIRSVIVSLSSDNYMYHSIVIDSYYLYSNIFIFYYMFKNLFVISVVYCTERQNNSAKFFFNVFNYIQSF